MICAFFLRLVPVVILHLRRILTCVAVLLELSDFFDNQVRGVEGGGNGSKPSDETLFGVATSAEVDHTSKDHSSHGDH